MTTIRIGTRGSALAMWQARQVARLLEESGGPTAEIVVIRTSGDEGPPSSPSTPASAAGSGAVIPPTVARPTGASVKQTFVKEIEDALLDGRIDIAVHSSKDLAATLPDGLLIAAALARGDPRDVLVLPDGVPGRDVHAVRRALGPSPRIGTTSVRRRAELRSLFPGAVFVDLRGNVDTRLRKLDAGECDVLALAAVGVERLGLSARISAHLSTDICVPAPGQGIVAVEAAAGAPPEVRTALAPLNDVDAETALVAERAVVRALGGGCQMPLGALATIDGQELSMVGLVASADGVTVIRALAYGTRGNPAAVGEKLADMLLERGAGRLLQG